MASLVQTFQELSRAVSSLEFGAAAFAAVPDEQVPATHEAIAELVRAAEKYAALSAADIARRSNRALGQDGLAWRSGFVNAEAMVQKLTGGSRASAGRLVKVGTMIAEAESADLLRIEAEEHPDGVPSSVAAAATPWHALLGSEVATGHMGAETANCIRRGLGEPGDGVSEELLTSTLRELVAECTGLDSDQAFRAARRARDRIDASGVAARAEARRNRQYWRQWRKPDGMVRGEYELDPENGAFVEDVRNQLLSPRLGGPRFVDATKKAWADALINDPRTTDRIAAESFVELLKIAADADPGTVFRGNRPAVRMIVHRTSASSGSGFGAIEGCPDPVTLETIERELCEGGFVPVEFDDDGQCLNVGREKRLFTRRQKLALAVRDGGCMWPDCARPAGWTEAHHITPWAAEHGNTDIADGICLCRRHHMLLHNRHWRILRRGAAEYWLVPPPEIDVRQRPVRLTSKASLDLQSPVRRRTRAAGPPVAHTHTPVVPRSVVPKPVVDRASVPRSSALRSGVRLPVCSEPPISRPITHDGHTGAKPAHARGPAMRSNPPNPRGHAVPAATVNAKRHVFDAGARAPD